VKRKDPETIGSVLQQYLVAIGADKHIKEIRVTQEWDKIVGPMIARNTNDINLKDGVLTVKFRSAIIRNEISMRRTSLITLINDAIGEEVIKSIVIR
jgi:predicted nucleic acid-binding Zn ribbon protein